MYYVDSKLQDLNRIFDQNSRKEYLRLDLNENPGGLPEDFIKETLSSVTPRIVAEYPETLEFTEDLADYLGTDITHLCLVNGSSEGIRFVMQAFTSPGGRIVGVTPSYAMFEVYSEMYGRVFEPVHYTEDLKMPVSNILEKLTEDVQLLILVNPNNPMGNTYSEEEFEQIFKKASENEITILIDEAYHYFYPKTFIKYALEKEHVFVTRTFSKLFSLAGLRLGYVAGWPEGIAIIQKLCTPHNVNAIAMMFAQKILRTPGFIDGLIDIHKKGRSFLEEDLTAHGYEYQGETGNFIFIKQKGDAAEIVRRMKEEKGILIKTYSGIGKFGTCLRVTTGAREYMEIFLKALYELDS